MKNFILLDIEYEYCTCTLIYSYLRGIIYCTFVQSVFLGQHRKNWLYEVYERTNDLRVMSCTSRTWLLRAADISSWEQDLMGAGVGGGADAAAGRMGGGPSYIILAPDASRQVPVSSGQTLTNNSGKAVTIDRATAAKIAELAGMPAPAFDTYD